jgi:HEAT repeat protein
VTGRPFTLTGDEQQRVERIDQLVAIGDQGVRELLASVGDPSWTVRRAAVTSLAALGDDAVPALCHWLATARTTEHEIAAVVDALAAALGERATPAVMALLAHPDPAVVADAANILGRRRALEATTALAAQLQHPDDNVAVAAIEALGALSATTTPTAATEALIAVIATRGFFRTFPALQVLARTGDPRAVQPIAALVPDPLFQGEAIRALGRTGSASAIPALAAALAGASPELVRTIAVALADLLARAEWSGAGPQVAHGMQPMLAPSVAALVAAVPGATPTDHAALATVLGRAGDPSVVPILVGMLHDDAVRAVAITGIKALGHDVELLAGELEPETTIAILPLVNASRDLVHVRVLLGDPDPEIRARACEALARLGDTTAVPALFEALGDGNPRVTLAAAGAIQALQTTDTAPRVLAALGSGSPAVKRQALRIIAYLGTRSAFDLVLACTVDPDRRVAQLAIAALAMIADPRVEPALEVLASAPDSVLRAAVMRAWGRRGSLTAVALLQAGLVDQDAWVRYYAAQALGVLDHAASAGHLLALLSDEMPHVRVAAIEALARLDAPAAWDALVAAVHSEDPDERRAALVGLAQRPRTEALPLLCEAAVSPDLATRLIAISGLAVQPSLEALPELVRATRDEELAVRDAALSLLADRDDRGATTALVTLALESALDHPVHAALSRPTPARIAALREALRGASEQAAPVLVAALARMADPRATAALFAGLTATSPAARRAAASSLVATHAEGALAQIKRLASEDPDPEVRRICLALVRAT